VWAFYFVNNPENFHVFRKKVAEKFGGYEKSAYLCIRFRAIFGRQHEKKEFFERFT
jgi:hypothetical protein